VEDTVFEMRGCCSGVHDREGGHETASSRGPGQPKLRTAIMSKAATMPNATAAAVPFSRLRGITVKAVATIAKPAATGAIWVKVAVISPTFRAFDWLAS
jgi:hypothetical protein